MCPQNCLDFVQFQLSKLSKLHLFSPPCSASGQSLRFCRSHPFKSKLFEFRKLSFVFLHLAAQSPGRLRLRKCILWLWILLYFLLFDFWLRIPTFLTRGRRCVVADLLSSASVITALSPPGNTGQLRTRDAVVLMKNLNILNILGFLKFLIFILTFLATQVY